MSVGFLLWILSIAGLSFSLKLGVLQLSGNSSTVCQHAIQMAKNQGDCVSDNIQLLYRDACVPDRAALGTINAAALHFNDQVDGFVGPPCVDESAEIGRLAFFWQRPVFARNMASKLMLDNTMFPTVIETSLTSAAGMAKSVYEIYKLIDNNNTLNNINLYGPSARTSDHYPLAQAVYDYLDLTDLMLVSNFGLFDERNTFPDPMRLAIQQNGSKLLVVAIDFYDPDSIHSMGLEMMYNIGFVVVILSNEPIESLADSMKKYIYASKALVIAPSLTDYPTLVTNLTTMDSDNLLGLLNGKFSMFLSCYGYCYGSKYGTTGNTQNYFTFFKNKQFSNAFGTFSFDAAGALLVKYGVYNLPTEFGSYESVMEVTSAAMSSCQGFDCFSVSTIVKNDGLLAQKKKMQKDECTSNDSCVTRWGWFAGGLGLLIAILLVALLLKWRKQSHINMYRMHWKIKKDTLKIIENKQSSVKGSKPGEAAGLLGKRRAIVSYALIDGKIKAEFVSLKQNRKIKWSKAELKLLFDMKMLSNDNLTKFLGVCCNELDSFFLLHALIERASLEDFIKDSEFNLDSTFKSAFIRDIIKGLTYLHKSPLKYHGLLTSSNCLIDNNWVLKLNNFGYSTMINEFINNGTLFITEQLPLQMYPYFAPELLSGLDITKNYPRGTQEGDVYSFGVILHQVIFGHMPFDSYNFNPRDLITKIAQDSLKPEISNADNDPLIGVMMSCWLKNPDQRPKLKAINQSINAAFAGTKGQLVDQMLKMNEKYAAILEKIVDERSALLHIAQEQIMRLLNELLPKSIAAVLKSGGTVPPRSYDFATVLFVQVCEFQDLVFKSGPEEVIQFLNDIYDTFDGIINTRDAYKVETTGETYMVASGVPNENDGNHLSIIADISLDIREASYTYKVPHLPDFVVRVKIGFHCGPIAAGVIGIRSPRYCLFGDTVNFSSRMQSNCPPNQIQTSEVTALKLMAVSDEYKLVKRGIVQVKGKGAVNCYWLNEHIHGEVVAPRTSDGRRSAQRNQKTAAGRNSVLAIKL